MKYKKIIICLLCLLILTGLNVINAYLVNPKQLQIREETIVTDKISSSLDNLTIAYFSDLYYGTAIKEKELAILVDTINSLKADIVVFGGDLLSVNADENDQETIMSYLSKINSTKGKFAIKGENDTDDTFINSGFKLLNNTSQKIYTQNGDYLNLILLDSLNPDLNEGFDGITNDRYNIVVSHYPDNFAKIDKSLCDLMLAGHSLGGRAYFPLINLFNRPEGAVNYFRGKYKENEAVVDITSGVGTDDKISRFNADSEVVFYKLKCAQ